MRAVSALMMAACLSACSSDTVGGARVEPMPGDDAVTVTPLGTVNAAWGTAFELRGNKLRGNVRRIVVGEGPNEAWITPSAARAEWIDTAPPLGLHTLSGTNFSLPFASHGGIVVELEDGRAIDAGVYEPPFVAFEPLELPVSDDSGAARDVLLLAVAPATLSGVELPREGERESWLVTLGAAGAKRVAISSEQRVGSAAIYAADGVVHGYAVTDDGVLAALSDAGDGPAWTPLELEVGAGARVVHAGPDRAWVVSDCAMSLYAAANDAWAQTRGPVPLPEGLCAGAFGEAEEGTLYGVGSISTGDWLDSEAATVASWLAVGAAAFEPPSQLTVSVDDSIYFREVRVTAGRPPLVVHCNNDTPDTSDPAEAMACRAHVFEADGWQPFGPKAVVSHVARYAVRGMQTAVVHHPRQGTLVVEPNIPSEADVLATNGAGGRLVTMDIDPEGVPLVAIASRDKLWAIRKR